MREPVAARNALERAQSTEDEVERSVWLAKAADFAVRNEAVLVGGAAVNLHTASYRPTDIDLCAYIDEGDRTALIDVGFEHIQGDHFSYVFPDGEKWLVEFPESVVDGDVMRLDLGSGVTLSVITVESLILDRIRQATDGTGVTFDEAVRLCLAVRVSADWKLIETRVREQDRRSPRLELDATYDQVISRANEELRP